MSTQEQTATTPQPLVKTKGIKNKKPQGGATPAEPSSPPSSSVESKENETNPANKKQKGEGGVVVVVLKNTANEQQQLVSTSSSSSSSTDLLQHNASNGNSTALSIPRPYNKYAVTMHNLRIYNQKTIRSKGIWWYKDYGLKVDENNTPICDNDGKPVYDFNTVFKLDTERKEGKNPGLKLTFLDDKLEYNTIMTPIGVLSHSKMSLIGNRDEPNLKYKPGNASKVKQSIQWSSKAYCKEGATDNDPNNDEEALAFVDVFGRQLSREWFLEALRPLLKNSALSQQVNRIKTQYSVRSIKNPNDEQLLTMLSVSELLEMCRKDESGVYFSRFSSNLFRYPRKNEFKDGSRYVAECVYHKEVYESSDPLLNGRIYNYVPIYAMRSQEEINANWKNGICPYKEVNRKDFKGIQDGDLGCCIISFQARNDSGDKVAIQPYLAGILWLGRGTELSKTRIEPKIEDIPEPLQFPGIECYEEVNSYKRDMQRANEAGFPSDAEGQQALLDAMNETETENATVTTTASKTGR